MKRIFTVLLCLAGSTLFGEERSILVLTKEEAMTRALERNLGIKIVRAAVEIAGQGVELAKGSFDPELTASFNSASVDDQNLESAGVGVNGLVATGGTYSVGIDSSETLSSPGDFDAFAGLTFRQPLLRNFGFSANLAALRIARYQFDLSEWEYKQLLLDTIASTIFAFNDLYEAQKNLESAIRIRDLTNQTVMDNDKRVSLGAMARLDIVEAQAQLASRDDRVLSASNNVTRAQNRIKQLIFDNASEALSYQLQAEAYAESEVFDEFSTYLSALLENSPNYHIGEIALEIARLRLVRDKNQALPSLDLIAQFGFSGSGSSMGASIDSAFSGGEETYSLGASFGFPIMNRSRKAREAISVQRERIAEVDLESIKQAIQLEFFASFEVMQTNFKRVYATQLARELAEQSLEAGEKKLNAGTSSTFIILRLQSDLALAELREISAIANYNRSVADFNRLRGVLE